MKELVKIQSELKAPKSQYNNFGKYAYRSAEDILEAVKPLLKENNCIFTLSDDIVEFGNVSARVENAKKDKDEDVASITESVGRIYVKATATITNKDGVSVSVSAFARESNSQKGMNSAQITGSASSYARKYAMNGLFAIDDNKDPDATNRQGMDGTDKPKANVAPKAVAPKAIAPKAVKAKAVTPKVEEIPKEARQRIADATKREDVASVWKDFANLRNNQEFNELVKQASAQFPKK